MFDHKIQEYSYRSFSTKLRNWTRRTKTTPAPKCRPGQIFSDEDHMTCYEDKTNHITVGVLGSTFYTEMSSGINGKHPAWT